MSHDANIGVLMTQSDDGTEITLSVKSLTGDPVTQGQLSLVLSQLCSDQIARAMGIDDPRMSKGNLHDAPKGVM